MATEIKIWALDDEKLLFTFDGTLAAVEEAVKRGVNLRRAALRLT